jgi:hypothetical protein
MIILNYDGSLTIQDTPERAPGGVKDTIEVWRGYGCPAARHDRPNRHLRL